jgi:hypothetical protein
MSKMWLTVVLAITLPMLTGGCAEEPELVVSAPDTGFALYRSGRLSPADIEEMCGYGIEEILVLDGEGAERECRYQKITCPGLRVRYDFTQEEDRPVSIDFLKAFDAWIEEAQTNGTKVAIRCRHGWHRTGRLVAYYRIRFEGVAATEAIKEMQDIGHMMWRHPTLNSQVEAYEDIVAGRPCASGPESCPLEQPDGGLLHGLFPHDSCDTRGTSGTSNEQNM